MDNNILNTDLYKILNVDKNSTKDEIKKSFRTLSKKYHPDVTKGDDSEFKKINTAYSILGDDNNKSEYDIKSEYGKNYDPNINNNPFGDIFGDIFNMSNFSNLNKKNDISITISLNILEIINGTSKTIKYNIKSKCDVCDGNGGTDLKECPYCKGTGRIVNKVNTLFGTIRQESECRHCNDGFVTNNTCKKCNGDGLKDEEKIINIDIPEGVSESARLKMFGYGNYNKKTKKYDDLIIKISEIPNPIFKRINNDVYMSVEISIIDAILGNNLSIDGPRGKLKIKIESGVTHGHKIKLEKSGIKDPTSGIFGDLFIVLHIKIPKNITNEEKIILKKLRDSKNFN